MKLLHFADAHIDMANYGKHDPETGLPLRVLDFLRALDTIVDAAISEKVDMVIFAGDAYKDRSPAPTFSGSGENASSAFLVQKSQPSCLWGITTYHQPPGALMPSRSSTRWKFPMCASCKSLNFINLWIYGICLYR